MLMILLGMQSLGRLVAGKWTFNQRSDSTVIFTSHLYGVCTTLGNILSKKYLVAEALRMNITGICQYVVTQTKL